MPKPTIVLVPGAWHQPEIYDATIEKLSKFEYRTIALPLPSVGAKPPHENFDQDVKAIKGCITSLVEKEGKDVILVTHSYSGLPGNESPAGLSKNERQAKGLKGGVIRLVFIQALAMAEGFCCMNDDAKMDDWMTPVMEEGVIIVKPENARRVFYNDISEAEAEPWIEKLLPQSMGVFTSTQTYAGWKHIPSTFVTGLLDQSDFKHPYVELIISNARQQHADAFDVVETCEEGGHCLMISHPGWLADVLRRSAGEAC